MDFEPDFENDDDNQFRHGLDPDNNFAMSVLVREARNARIARAQDSSVTTNPVPARDTKRDSWKHRSKPGVERSLLGTKPKIESDPVPHKHYAKDLVSDEESEEASKEESWDA